MASNRLKPDLIIHGYTPNACVKAMNKKFLILITAVTAVSSGCLTRTSNPTLPYVQPAHSSASQEQAAGQVASRLQDIETEMQRLRDKLERLQSGNPDDRNIRELSDRVNHLEKQIGVETARRSSSMDSFPNPAGSGGVAARAPQKEENPTKKSPMANLDNSDDIGELRNPATTPDEKAYRQAYSTFKKGALEQAVTQFEDFLKKNPKSQFAPSAIYWLGEVRLEQGRFDEAVLQFDRVIKEYPGSKKELSALFKQGQAFEKMGDSKSAKIIFQKIVKDNPHTTQGRLSASRLKTLAGAE